MIYNMMKFIREINNLCRKDSRIVSWCVYRNDRDELQTDITFIDYNKNLYEYHNAVRTSDIRIVDTDEIDYFAYSVFSELQGLFERIVLRGETEDE